jgi:hypothetical protein
MNGDDGRIMWKNMKYELNPPICVKWWRKKTFKIWKWYCHYGVEDWNKYYSLIQIRVLNVVVDLGRKWQRRLKGEKKFKFPKATKVVQWCK